MTRISKRIIQRFPVVLAVALSFFAINSVRAAPALKESECTGKFTRSSVTVTTQLVVGAKDEPTYRVTWRLPAKAPLSTIVRPPPTDRQVGFLFEKWGGYVDQKNDMARLSGPSGMEEVKLTCRQRSYGGPQKGR